MTSTVNAPTPELVDAAARVIADRGYSGLTLERVAEAAGLSRVTLHRRAVTKEAILHELGRRAAESYRAALWPILTASGTALDRLTRALEAICDQAERHMELLQALAAFNDELFHEKGSGSVMTRDHYVGPLRRLLLDGAIDGTIRPVDANEMATVIFNQVGQTYMHLRTGHGWSRQRAFRGATELVLAGLAAHR